MKLAEALILRADRQKRIEQLRQRLLRNAKVQEGDRPAEDPRDLIAEVERTADDLERLVQRINRTNAATRLDGELTLSDALARRDLLKLRQTVFRDLAEAATVEQVRYSGSEIRFQGTVDVAATQRQADDLARRYRELDTRIQQANWEVELLEE